MTRNQIGLVPSSYVNPGPNNIAVPNAENVDELQSKIFVLSVGVTLYIFSQVLRSILTTDKEPERPEPSKPKTLDNMGAEENQNLMGDGNMMDGNAM